ncbi:hypothetical protein PC116_g15315 [Phytophthora cactorum]|nr:hypothetical protein PC111_g10395 [Phytophthora cactorum]KAG3015037.1 hypothetical protein PC120_g12379 [Phytophthora cactorum]KAG4054044.1 hypothetical protein PC123_g10818 [Phytophthora cactorum]KAG4236590.1 hypothetical protein PC116_g15315 [Phytophthora cactorum]
MLEDARINGQRRISVILETLFAPVTVRPDGGRATCDHADQVVVQVGHIKPGHRPQILRAGELDILFDVKIAFDMVRTLYEAQVRIPMGWATWEQALPKVTRDTFG